MLHIAKHIIVVSRCELLGIAITGAARITQCGDNCRVFGPSRTLTTLLLEILMYNPLSLTYLTHLHCQLLRRGDVNALILADKYGQHDVYKVVLSPRSTQRASTPWAIQQWYFCREDNGISQCNFHGIYQPWRPSREAWSLSSSEDKL